MKICFLLVLALIFSCKSEKSTLSTIQNNLEAYFKPTLADPGSYEYVEITNLDTITQKKFAQRVIEMLQMNLVNAKDRMATFDQAEAVEKKRLSANRSDSIAMKNVMDIEYSRNILLKQQHEVDSLKASLTSADADMFKFIQLNLTFNEKNAQGQKIQHRYYIKLNEDLSVQSANELKQ